MLGRTTSPWRSAHLAYRYFPSRKTCAASPVQMVCLHGLLGSAMNFAALCGGVAEVCSSASATPFLQEEVRSLLSCAPSTFANLCGHGASTNHAVYSCVAYDCRNHGKSFHHPSMSLDNLADDLQAFLQGFLQHPPPAAHEPSTPRSASRGVEGRVSLFSSTTTPLRPAACGDTPVPLLLVGHSMGGVSLMHWLWREHVLHWSRKSSPSSSLPLAFENHLYRIVGAVVIDVAPMRRPLVFAETIRRLKFLPNIPLEGLHTLQEVEQWLMANGPPELFNKHTMFQTRYHLSNLDFPAPEEDAPQPTRWRIGLHEILNNMDNIVWCNGGEAVHPNGTSVVPVLESLPLLFVFGGRSTYSHPTAHKSIRRYFQRSVVVDVKDADHFLHIHSRKTFSRLLTNFAHMAEHNSIFV